MNHTVFHIDGGAGRVIAAIPALLKFHKNNPNDDFKVLVGGWDTLLWGIPELQDRVFNPENKGIFDRYILDCKKIISPEPYREPGYFKQEISLVEAFDRCINNTEDHKDLGAPVLVLNKTEEKMAANIISDVRSQQKKDLTIVIQPYGRGAKVDRGHIIDDASRSLDTAAYLLLAKKLATKYNLIYFGEQEFAVAEDTYAFKFNGDLRSWMSVIESADYFVGCDSVGQHMARAFDTPGTVIFGSTFPINTSYPDFFQIIEKSGQKKYSPIRICGLDGHLADRYNDKLMDFSEDEVHDMFLKIVKDIEAKVKK
jgi:hypothetical protein